MPNSPQTVPELQLLCPNDWQDYELIDTGAGQKLERFGPYTFIRPEPQAIWKPALNEKVWNSAHAIFQPTREESGGYWQFRQPVEPSWTMHRKSITFKAQTTSGRHLGIFPEQAVHWDWIAQCVRAAKQPPRVLCLFGYTGLACLAAAEAGAKVTYVDASKKALEWARHNQSLSGLSDRPIRWLLDDAIKFVQREARRGEQYEGMILDPPKFGRGPKGEIWDFFKLIPELMGACRAILSSKPVFVVITAYAIRASALCLHYGLQEMMKGYRGNLTSGELALKEKSAGRFISTAIFSRWQSVE